MVRARALSAVARRVLAALAEGGWRHGYDLCREAEVKSGTLYPLLIRWEAQGYLSAEWRESEGAARPPRHVYRLTPAGVRLAAENPAVEPDPAPAGRPA